MAFFKVDCPLQHAPTTSNVTTTELSKARYHFRNPSALNSSEPDSFDRPILVLSQDLAALVVAVVLKSSLAWRRVACFQLRPSYPTPARASLYSDQENPRLMRDQYMQCYPFCQTS